MQVAQALGAGQPNMQQLMGLASDPWASDSQKSIINSLLGQQMQQQDPMYQLQMQAAQQGLTKGDLEIQQMLNPPAPAPEWQTETTDSGDILRWNDNDPNAAPSVFYDAPDAPAPELTDTQINLAWRAEQAGLQPGTPEYAEFMRSGGQSTGMALSVGPDGTVQFAQGAGAGSRPLTESQSKLTLFQTLQTETQPVLLDLEKQFNPGNLQDAAARSTPIAGNFFQSEQGQIYNSAATAWAEGALRIATGAAATPEEMERTKRAYFAQPGDTPNTIAFKAQMREMYNRAINNSLGQPGEGALPIPSEFAQQVGTSGQGPVANQSQARPITTEAEYNALPAGAVYMDPTGQIRTKR